MAYILAPEPACPGLHLLPVAFPPWRVWGPFSWQGRGLLKCGLRKKEPRTSRLTHPPGQLPPSMEMGPRRERSDTRARMRPSGRSELIPASVLQVHGSFPKAASPLGRSILGKGTQNGLLYWLPRSQNQSHRFLGLTLHSNPNWHPESQLRGNRAYTLWPKATQPESGRQSTSLIQACDSVPRAGNSTPSPGLLQGLTQGMWKVFAGCWVPGAGPQDALLKLGLFPPLSLLCCRGSSRPAGRPWTGARRWRRTGQACMWPHCQEASRPSR